MHYMQFMNTYRITAQSFTSSQRIAKMVKASSEADAFRAASIELHADGQFYVVDVRKV